MEEAIGYLCAVIMCEHTCAANAQGIGENRYRDSRSDENNRTPETVALDSLQEAAAACIISIPRAWAREVSLDDGQRDKRHQ